jgi:hypothetical protein
MYVTASARGESAEHSALALAYVLWCARILLWLEGGSIADVPVPSMRPDTSYIGFEVGNK